jgi:hypothetical protein
MILDGGVVDSLILLLHHESLKVKEAALECLASVCNNQYQTVSAISLMKSIFRDLFVGQDGTEILSLILSLVRQGNNSLKLQACAW